MKPLAVHTRTVLLLALVAAGSPYIANTGNAARSEALETSSLRAALCSNSCRGLSSEVESRECPEICNNFAVAKQIFASLISITPIWCYTAFIKLGCPKGDTLWSKEMTARHDSCQKGWHKGHSMHFRARDYGGSHEFHCEYPLKPKMVHAHDGESLLTPFWCHFGVKRGCPKSSWIKLCNEQHQMCIDNRSLFPKSSVMHFRALDYDGTGGTMHSFDCDYA